jgi:hypothetical protein
MGARPKKHRGAEVAEVHPLEDVHLLVLLEIAPVHILRTHHGAIKGHGRVTGQSTSRRGGGTGRELIGRDWTGLAGLHPLKTVQAFVPPPFTLKNLTVPSRPLETTSRKPATLTGIGATRLSPRVLGLDHEVAVERPPSGHRS